MIYTDQTENWKGFTEVKQDTPGLVVTQGGLYTENLMNCLCLILTNGKGRYGMLHVSPGHSETREWVSSLIAQVDADQAIVTGANGGTQSDERKNELESLLRGLAVLDETKSRWVPATLYPFNGSYRSLAGYAAVNASTDEYALRASPFDGIGTTANTCIIM